MEKEYVSRIYSDTEEGATFHNVFRTLIPLSDIPHVAEKVKDIKSDMRMIESDMMKLESSLDALLRCCEISEIEFNFNTRKESSEKIFTDSAESSEKL